jgi:enamine deaminase RidA (YjgF/YER057c/UK114 family)
MQRRSVSSGARWESIVGYSRAVRVGEHVYVTGTTAFGPDGRPMGGDDPYEQARRAVLNIEQALRGLDASLADVVRTRMYVVDIERDWQEVGRAHAEFFGDVRPATSMAEVSRLIEPWMRVEIEADAYVESR